MTASFHILQIRYSLKFKEKRKKGKAIPVTGREGP
jgi:hypothetical protein